LFDPGGKEIMRNYYAGLFTAGYAGCAALQGGILQAVQHYKGYESLFTVASAHSISDQRSLR
jgi:hypothetical protein